MTCAKCGMSIDANAGERLHAVRGRVKEKPEIEIDSSLPPKPSTFPFEMAIMLLLVVVVGGIGLVMYIKSRPDAVSDEQRENLRSVEAMQKAFVQLWDANRVAHDVTSCKVLVEIVTKPCLPTVNPSALAFDEAVVAIGTASQTRTCTSALDAYTKSRHAAKCD